MIMCRLRIQKLKIVFFSFFLHEKTTLQWSKVVSEAIFSTNLGYVCVEKWSSIFVSGTSSARNENQRPLFNRNIPLISGKYGLRNHFWPLESRFLMRKSEKKFFFIFLFVFVFDCSSLNSFSRSSSTLRIFPKLFNYHETVKIQHDVLELIRSELELCTHICT